MFQNVQKITKSWNFIFTQKILKNCSDDFNTEKIRNVYWAIKSAYQNDFCDHCDTETEVMDAKNAI